MLKIYFKDTCSTCRTALKLIRDHTAEAVEKVDYINAAPDKSEIRGLLRMLGIPAEQLVRKKEKLYREKYAGRAIGENDWIDILSKHPVLIQRPIVVKGNKAIIGRPAGIVVPFVSGRPAEPVKNPKT